MNWSNILKILGITSVAGAIVLILNIQKVINWFHNLWTNIYHKLTRYKPKIPRETLRFVSRPQHCWWHMGKSNNQPAMQVVCDWYVTNITNKPVMVCGARIKKPRVDGFMCVRHPNSNIYGDYYILPHHTTDGRADFWIQPPIKKIGQPLILDLEFIDQYGNIHRVKKVKFNAPKPKLKDTTPPLEPVVSISNPVEKEIISVLQNELHRYRECGRRVGGLGSITLTYGGRNFKGVGTDWRESESPKQQSIVHDPANAKIESDNGAILIKYYNTLGQEQKMEFIDILLSRMYRDNAYSSIGYFFLYVCYRLGLLDGVLTRAKESLKGDSAYGFSDLLRLLDGFLKYEYPNFTSEHLDVIEKFIEGLDDHTFRIPERVRAIRAYLLAQKVNSIS
jgi:hypothetical protein